MSGWVKLTLRIASEVLSADEIQTRLNDVPSETIRKGEPVSKRNPHGPAHRESICFFESPRPEDVSPEEHLTWLFEFCDRHRAELHSLAGACTTEAWLGYGSDNGQGGFSLTSQQMAKLGSMGVDIVVDLYASSGEE